MAKRRVESPTFVYPPHQGYRGGCKVGWHYYTKHTDAVLASDVAKLEAAYKAGQGYDFGYQSPGRIELIPADVTHGCTAQFAGMYEVCVP